MPIAAVQRVGKGSVGAAASVSIGSGDGWATPTAGNLLVFSANSDALVTLSGAGTVSSGPSIIDGNGTYTWYKIATGAETTITGTPSVSDDIVITACEYSGVSTFDAQNSATIAGTNGSVTTAAAVSTTASADLVIGFALLHNTVQTNHGTGPAWTNSFVNVLTASTGTTSATGVRCNTFVGELLPAGAAGSYSTVCSWTNDYANRQHIILAFKASAGAPAARPPRPTVIRQAVGFASTW